MPLTSLPTKTDGSIGRIKADAFPATDLDIEVPAAEYELIKTYLIDIADEVGIHVGTVGNLNDRVDALELAVAFPLQAPDGTIANPSYAFSGDSGMGIFRQDPFLGFADNGAPMFALRQVADDSGDAVGAAFFFEVNQPGSAAVGWTAIDVDVDPTSDTGTGTKSFMQFSYGGTSMFRISSAGDIIYPAGQGSSGLFITQATPTPGQTASWLFLGAGVGGAASGAPGLVGGNVFVTGGAGGAGDGSFAAGAGGTATIQGGQAGADGGGGGANSGSVLLTTLAATGAGTAGTIQMRIASTLITTVIPQGLQTVIGSVGAPSYTFTGDLNTGIYSPGADQVSVSVGGVAGLHVRTTSVEIVQPGTTSAPGLYFNGDTDTGIFWPNTNQIGVTCATVNIMRWSSTAAQLNVTGSATAPSFTRVGEATGFFFPTGHTIAISGGATGAGLEIVRFTAPSGANPQVLLPNGSLTNPILAQQADPDTGIIFDSNRIVGVVAGVERFRIANTAVRASQQVQAIDGTATTPGYSFTSDADTGIYSSGADQIAMALGGVQVWNLSTSGVRVPDGTNGTPSYSFLNDTNTGFYRAVADEIRVATGGTQRVAFNNTTVFPMIDNTIALGTSSLRWTNFYWSGQTLGPDGTVGAPSYSFASDPNSGLHWQGADQVVLVTGGTQKLRAESSQVVCVVAGTSALPAFEVGNNAGVGLWNPAANQLGLQANSESLILDNDAATPSLRPDADNVWTLGEAALRYADVFAVQTTIGDLNMRDPFDSDGAWWTLVESHDGIYALNRRNGKRYAVQLRELSENEKAPLPYSERVKIFEVSP